MHSYHTDDFTQATPGRFVSPSPGGVYIDGDDSPYSRLDDLQGKCLPGASLNPLQDRQIPYTPSQGGWLAPGAPCGRAGWPDYNSPELVRARAIGPYHPFPSGGLGAMPRMRHMWAACPKTEKYRPQDQQRFHESRWRKEGFSGAFQSAAGSLGLQSSGHLLLMFFVLVLVLSLLMRTATPVLTIVLDQRSCVLPETKPSEESSS